MQRNVLVRDLGLPGLANPADSRSLDLVLRGILGLGGVPVVVDVTVRSPVRGDGSLRTPETAQTRGVSARYALADKERKYGDVMAASHRCRFMVVVAETGGFLCDSSQQLIRKVVKATVEKRDEAVRLSYRARVMRQVLSTLSVGLQKVVAQNILDPGIPRDDDWGRATASAELYGGHRDCAHQETGGGRDEDARLVGGGLGVSMYSVRGALR